MTRTAFLFAFLLWIFVASAANAQSEREQLTNRYVALGANTVSVEINAAIAAEALLDRIREAQPTLTQDKQDKLRAIALDGVAKALFAVAEAQTRAEAARLSVPELRAVIGFYETDLGRSAIRKLSDPSVRLSPEVILAFSNAQDDLAARLRDAGATLP